MASAQFLGMRTLGFFKLELEGKSRRRLTAGRLRSPEEAVMNPTPSLPLRHPLSVKWKLGVSICLSAPQTSLGL